jgi:adenylyltransferase/sulfurtransferase
MNERYSRQILFREIGREGQEKLLASRVLIVGCGALGA